VRAAGENRICVFCHTPHMAITKADGLSIPLWNHSLSGASYQLPQSSTLLSRPIQPDGASKLCLSCHDGTIAIGAIVNTGGVSSTISMSGTGAGGVMPGAPGTGSNVGQNLSGHHVISIALNADLVNAKRTQCNSQGTFMVCLPTPPVKLSPTGNGYPSTGVPSGSPTPGVQCSSCHDPHSDPVPGTTYFLRVGDKNNQDPLCTACHRMGCSC
jgi:predicted CXXCH cytochrome family protein